MASKAQIFQTLLAGVRAAGVTLSGGKVYFYAAGTVTLKTVYEDRNKAVEAENPFTLGSNGTAELYGDGLYDIKVDDADDVQKYYWDGVSLVDILTSGVERQNSDFASLNQAITEIGSTPTTLNISTADFPMTDNATVPSTLVLKSVHPGSIDQGAYTLTINSPFSPGAYQVFTGSGAVAGLKEARPEWWGTDAAAVQSAINAVTTGNVILSQIYTVSRRVAMTQVGGAPVCDAILIPKTGVNIIGTGYNSGFKIADNFSAGGDYVLFGTDNLEATDNIRFSNFRVDGNAANNLHPGGAAVRRAMAMWLFDADNVQVDGCWFENNPGTNTIKLGSDHVDYRGLNCSIRNNTFKYQGGAITGNRGQADHSTIYASGENIKVESNTFIAADAVWDWVDPSVVIVMAIELHGRNIIAANNKITNYVGIGYSVNDGISGIGGDHHIWQGNIGTGILSLGISLWSLDYLHDIMISNNLISLSNTINPIIAGIYQSRLAPDTTKGVDNIVISNNVIRADNPTPAVTAHGIYLTAVTNGVISGNSISYMPSSAIVIYDTTLVENANAATMQNGNLTITGNNIANISLLGTSPAIDLDHVGETTMDGVRISGNRISATTPYSITRPTNLISDIVFSGTLTDDLASIAAGASTIGTIEVIGAKIGDSVNVVCSIDPDPLVLKGWVWAENAVKFAVTNTSAAPFDLGEATFTAYVSAQ